jgi:hypothetical protein
MLFKINKLKMESESKVTTVEIKKLNVFEKIEIAFRLTQIMSTSCIVGNVSLGENNPEFEQVFSADDKLTFKSKILSIVKSIEI